MKNRQILKATALGAVLMFAIMSCDSPSNTDDGGQAASPTASESPATSGTPAASDKPATSGNPTAASKPTTPESPSQSQSQKPLPGISADMVANARIPSMCGFPAGKLRDGVLTKKHPEFPNATPPELSDLEIAAGDLNGDGADELAAVFYCDNGGVQWPARIQVFGSAAEGISPLGKPFDIGSITNGARGLPNSFKYENGQLAIADELMLPTDPAAAPSGNMEAMLAWNGQRLVTTTFSDVTNGKVTSLKTSLINGTWCPAESARKPGPRCMVIEFPDIKTTQGENETFLAHVDGKIMHLNTYVTPLGDFYPAKEAVADSANPGVAKEHLDKDRIYNSQTQVLFLRSSK